MTVKTIGLVAVRLLALYFFLTGIFSNWPMILPFFGSIKNASLLIQVYGPLLLAGGVYVVLGLVVWRYAYLVSDRLVPEDQGSEKISGILNAKDLYAIAFGAVGFLILSSAADPLSMVILIVVNTGFSEIIWKYALESALYILLAVVLINYSLRTHKT